MTGSRRRVIVALAAAAATLATTSAAQSRVIKAEGILPPGQSGFVALTGLTTGEGSPHLYDQNQLFIDFKYKSMEFGQPGTEERPRDGIRIVRDAYGVPAIYGDTEDSAWFGAGYAAAQDRLFELEAFRHATQGKLAELTGKGSLGADYDVRRDFYTPSELTKMYDDLPLAFKQRILAYRDGINLWIQTVGFNPLQLPAEYAATLTALAPWKVTDTIAVGAYLARTVPSGDGSELRNLRAIQESGSPKVMDKLLPLSIKGQRSTIPRSEGLFSQGYKLTAAQAKSARTRSLKFVKTLPQVSDNAARAAKVKADLPPGQLGRVGGSSMFAVRAPGNRALLFNGPQLGFATPELFIEMEVHAPGIDIRGVTAPGAPVIAIGHNGKVAWGITSGLSDEDDLYAEKLDPSNRERYMYKGQWRQMECRNENFEYHGGVADIINGTIPEAGSVGKRFCRTVHGPVQLVKGNVAYARKYAIWGRELETLTGLDAVNHAENIRDVDAAARKLTWNENLMAADSQGNIGYWHPGLVQIRPKKYDQRLPLPGTGEAEWPGLVPRSKMPHIINPKQGWLANWNNIPSQGWTSGDGESSERVTGPFHRVGWLEHLTRGVKANPTYEQAAEAVRLEGSYAQQRFLADARLKKAAKGATGNAKTVLATLLAWDGDYVKTDAAGTIDAGVATWEAFKTAAAEIAVKPLGKGADEFEKGPGSSHIYDVSDKEAYALRTLTPAGYRKAAAAAEVALAKQFGTSDPAKWRSPRAMYKVSAQGAGQAPPLPFFDRGTWNQIIEVGP